KPTHERWRVSVLSPRDAGRAVTAGRRPLAWPRSPFAFSGDEVCVRPFNRRQEQYPPAFAGPDRHDRSRDRSFTARSFEPFHGFLREPCLIAIAFALRFRS